MQKNENPIIDLTGLSELRRKILSTDPALLFSTDMQTVLWANAPGARFFGGNGLAALLGIRFEPDHPLIRQFRLAAAQIEPGGPIIRGFRISHGGRTQFIQCELAGFVTPWQKECILLTSSDRAFHPGPPEHEAARNAVAAFSGVAANLAILDSYGLILAADDAFLDLDIDPDDLEQLAGSARGSREQGIERHLSLEDGRQLVVSVAAIDEEGQRLFLHAAEGAAEADAATDKKVAETAEGHRSAEDGDIEDSNALDGADAESGQPLEQAQPDASTGREGSETDEKRGAVAAGPMSPIRSLLDRWYLRQTDFEAQSAGRGDSKTDSGDRQIRQGAARSAAIPMDKLDFGAERPADEAADDLEIGTPPSLAASAEHRGPGSQSAEPADIAESPEEIDQFVFAADGEPVRFAWIADSDGIFRSVSPELARTVGPNAADIVGRHWRDVANVFGFDRTGEIEELMHKRDTWSGKSVLWPVQGTDMAVPVDLAALPAFGSSRKFDGFRGFGIIRTADVVIDPEETGMALSGPTDALAGAGTNPDAAALSGKSEDVPEASAGEPVETGGAPQKHETSAKVLDLTRLRSGSANSDERLSGQEAHAFEEIGRKLVSRGGDSENPQAVEADIVAGDDGSGKSENIRESTVKLGGFPFPAAVLANAELLDANADLLELAGYASVDEIAEAGGVEALLASAEYGAAQMTLIRRDRQEIPVQLRLQSLPGQSGKVLLLFPPAPAPEAAEQVAVDPARASELEIILDTATDGIIVTGSDGCIETANASAEALFGFKLSDVAREPLTSLFAVESRGTVEDYMAEIGQPGVASILNDGREVIGLEANGGLIPLFITIGRLGETQRRCVVLRDITQWKKAEEELVGARRAAESASEQKTEFLARVSHEIRTPLNAIIGFSDVMIEERFGPVENDRYREYLRDINRSGVHVLDLINDLLDISKIEAGKMDLNYEAVDLNQIVSETVALLQPQANGERIIIRTSLSRAVPKVVADARSMRQIILNLVSNAIKFTPMNGQVIVSTVYEGNGEVVMRVRDTGRGMSEHEIEQAMKPFSQLNVTDSKRGQGTGLGLPLTKALVEANRAYFDLDSSPGEGTIAHVHFPTQRVLAD